MHVLTSGEKHRAHAGRAHAPQQRLSLVFALTLAYTVAEVFGGIASNSLALLADAGHMATDAFALGLAVLAGWIARRPPDPGRTFGYQRAEILAALTNGLVLVAICGSISWEAVIRFSAPPVVATGLMAWVAAGRAEGFWEYSLSPWDVAAGLLLIVEAGGRVSDFSGRPWTDPGAFGRETLATNGRVHGEMLKVLRA